MGLFSAFQRAPVERIEPRIVTQPERRDAGFSASAIGLGTGGTASSVVAPHVAESLSAVCACIGAISSVIASLPARTYRTVAGGRIEVRDHPVSRLLRSPCRGRLTWPDFAEWLFSQVLLWGNAIAVVEYDGAGRPVALLPIPWQFVQVMLLPSGQLVYNVTQFIAPWGGTGLAKRYLESEVLHLRDRSDDGYLGKSRLSRAPGVLLGGLGLQEFSLAVWRNSATPSGSLEHPGILSREAKEFLSNSFNEAYSGANNARRTIVLEEGMRWNSVSATPLDAETLESRRFLVAEVCRLYQTPPQIVQAFENSAFTSSETASKWFATLTLTPWCRKLEAEFSRSIFGEGSDCHLEIDLTGLLRGDYAARWSAYATATQNRILTVDEIREIEGFGPMLAPAAEIVPGAPEP